MEEVHQEWMRRGARLDRIPVPCGVSTESIAFEFDEDDVDEPSAIERSGKRIVRCNTEIPLAVRLPRDERFRKVPRASIQTKMKKRSTRERWRSDRTTKAQAKETMASILGSYQEPRRSNPDRNDARMLSLSIHE